MASSKSTVARTTFDLPFEITVAILSRLPVKSLLRFKSACKTCLSSFGYPLFLCKPSTRQFREIPNSKWGDEHLNGIQVSFGFGFHPSANDYKLIRIVLYSSPIRECDMRADLLIRTPECLDRTWDLTDWNFTELDDKLAVVVVSPHERCFDVWVLNENESSWTNQVKVVSFPRIAGDMEDGVDGLCTVLGGGKNGQEEEAGEAVAPMASSKSTVARTTFDLPFEITVEILSRLPVKSLLRFKSVCKT
ncbi:hypothetical protein RHMOL_Rhmol05G0301000 [Rhododendron molle]|uniref:Uncharacterized protein n=1 Tax=Rhododendron molle TaxID=49168 RepID=A0ACC0NVV2_RHOML|nr:hypothetical protein RHMOL_Rhmol05G0301000 [Rhododendron molle]